MKQTCTTVSEIHRDFTSSHTHGKIKTAWSLSGQSQGICLKLPSDDFSLGMA